MAASSISPLQYPQRFYAAAASAGLGGSSTTPSSRFNNESALLLYALYQQATVGPCSGPKPRSWNPVEQSKWTSWNELGNMAQAEAMRLFVKFLEEEDPSWFTKVPEFAPELVTDVKKPEQLESETPNGNACTEMKNVPVEKSGIIETQDKDVISEGLGHVGIYDQWVSPPISGKHPKARYQHGAAVVQEKMYVFGGNNYGRYLNDLQVFDLKALTWSKMEAKETSPTDLTYSSSPAPCAGLSLVSWEDKILCIAGHTKDHSESVTVREFDPSTCIWTNLKTYGTPPVSRGGQSVTLVGTTLVIFGGEGAKRSLLNDLHILDLESMTWDEIQTTGVPPSPRSDHAAAVHAERYLLIFGGGSHATCFNDLHVLDLHSMEWSRPPQLGIVPSPRAGHAGITIGENWFIVGGGDNESGASETLVLNMPTLIWSVVTTAQGRVPVASEGLSLVLSSYTGEDILVSFGGYNGRYNNEVFVLKPSNKFAVQSAMIRETASDSISALLPTSNAPRDLEADIETSQSTKLREIAVDNDDAVPEAKEGSNERNLEALRSDKEELEAALSKEQLETLRLKKELGDAEVRNANLTEELQSVRGQLAAEQSRCFKLEVDVAELRQKLQSMESLQKELELLQRQKAASEEASLNAKQKQSSGGVWNWLTGNPVDGESDP